MSLRTMLERLAKVKQKQSELQEKKEKVRPLVLLVVGAYLVGLGTDCCARKGYRG